MSDNTNSTSLPKRPRTVVIDDYVWKAVEMGCARATMEGKGRRSASRFVRDAVYSACDPEDLEKALDQAMAEIGGSPDVIEIDAEAEVDEPVEPVEDGDPF